MIDPYSAISIVLNYFLLIDNHLTVAGSDPAFEAFI